MINTFLRNPCGYFVKGHRKRRMNPVSHSTNNNDKVNEMPSRLRGMQIIAVVYSKYP